MPGSVGKFGSNVAQAHGALGEVREHVRERERRGQALERCELRGQRVKQAVKELAFTREGAVAAAKHLVFELLELGRDVALGVLDGLAPLPVERRALRKAARQLDVVAVHAVVGDLELCQPGAAPLAILELEQVRIGAGRDRAQLVERRVVARSDDAAFAQQRGRRRDQGTRQKRVQLVPRHEIARRGGQQRRVEARERGLQPRQAGERLAQRREVPRPRRAQRDPRQDTLDVADAAQDFVQALVPVGAYQRLDRVVAGAKRLAVAERPPDPAPELARSHRGGRAVDHARERRVLAPREAGVEFEVAPRRRVHDQRVVARFARQGGEVRQGAFLRIASVLQQCPGRADRERQVLAAEAGEVLRAELRRQRTVRAVAQEMPGWTLDDARRDRGLDAFGQEQFRGPQALELCRERFAPLALEHAESARSEVQPGEAEALALHGERGEQAFAPRVEQGIVRDRAGRHDAHDLARDGSFRLADHARLLADRNRLAPLHEPCEVAVELFYGYAGHRDGRAA